MKLKLLLQKQLKTAQGDQKLEIERKLAEIGTTQKLKFLYIDHENHKINNKSNIFTKTAYNKQEVSPLN